MTAPETGASIEIDWFTPDVWFARLIVRVERLRNPAARYCHCGIRTPDGYFEAVETGFRVLAEPPRPPDASRRLPVASAADLQRGTAYLHRQVGQRYSWLTILADLTGALLRVHLVCTMAGQHVCSAAVSWALIYFGVRYTDSPDADTPDSLAVVYGV